MWTDAVGLIIFFKDPFHCGDHFFVLHHKRVYNYLLHFREQVSGYHCLGLAFKLSHHLRYPTRIQAGGNENNSLHVVRDLDVHGSGPCLQNLLTEGKVSVLESSVNNVIWSDRCNKVDRNTHSPGNTARCNVATSPRWTNNCDGVTDIVCQLEVAVNEVANLNQDPRPIDAVDGAQIVLRYVVRVREHGLDGNIQVI